MFRVRAYVPEDGDFIFSLAPRLAIGKQPWPSCYDNARL